MAIDLSCEQPITFNEAANFLPEASRPSLSTWWRWWRHGVKGVRLETVVVGGRRYTSASAVRRFAAALTATSTDTPEPTCVAAGHNEAEEEVENALDAKGI